MLCLFSLIRFYKVCMFNLDLLMNTIICHPIYIHIIRTILRVNNKCDKNDKQVLMDHDQSIACRWACIRANYINQHLIHTSVALSVKYCWYEIWYISYFIYLLNEVMVSTLYQITLKLKSKHFYCKKYSVFNSNTCHDIIFVTNFQFEY